MSFLTSGFSEVNERLGDHPWVRRALLCFWSALSLGAFVICLPRGASVAVAMLIVFILFAISAYAVVVTFDGEHQSFVGRLDGRAFLSMLLACVLLAFLIEVGTLAGSASKSPICLSDWNIKRIAIYSYFLYLVALLLLEYAPSDSFIRLRSMVARIDRTKIVRLILACLALCLMAYAASLGMGSMLGVSQRATFFFLLFVGVSLCSLAVFVASSVHVKEETVFLIVALSAGLSLIAALPITNLYSWDDEVHYRNALQLSYIGDSEFSSSDLMLANLFDVQEGHSVDASMHRWPLDFSITWGEEEIDHLIAELNDGYSRGAVRVDEGISASVLSYTIIGYVPSAIGLWIGRLLGLPFHWIFALGRICNLFSYCLVSYFAIKIIPYKKALLCAIALLPTTLFMASNYAYDPWLLSFGYLAIALLLREMMSAESVDGRSLLPILLTFFLSLGPKAVYFPLIGLMFLMPLKKIPSDRRKQYYGSVVALGLLVVITFLAPLVVSSGGGAGDARGGEGVNATEQLSFVLSNPMRYLSILNSFLFGTYLTLPSVSDATINLAYLGVLSTELPIFEALVPLFLLAVMLTDNNGYERKKLSIGVSLWSLFLFAVTLFGICTALYLSFTAVGLTTVAGVQPRYLLPLVLPLGVFVFNARIKISISYKRYSCFVFIASLLLISLAWWILLFSRLVV